MSADEAREAVAPRRLRWGAVAWITILALIGVVQLVRRQWGDAAIFGAAAVVLVADAVGALPVLDRLPQPPAAVVATGAALVAVVVAVVPRHSLVAGIAFSVVAAAAVFVAAARGSGEQASGPVAERRARWPVALRRLAWAWATIWIVACLWELSQVLLGGTTPGGRAAHPALSDLLNPLLDTVPGRVVFAVCWTAVGLFLVTRGRRR